MTLKAQGLIEYGHAGGNVIPLRNMLKFPSRHRYPFIRQVQSYFTTARHMYSTEWQRRLTFVGSDVPSLMASRMIRDWSSQADGGSNIIGGLA